MPAVELILLIEIGQRIGPLATIGLIMGTGIVGASLARQQGVSTIARLRRDLEGGRLPAEPIVDGVLILVAGAVLITPGVLTDLFGFLLLIPACRRLVKRSLKRRFERAVRAGTAGATMAFDGGGRDVTTAADEERDPAPTHRSGPLVQVEKTNVALCLHIWHNLALAADATSMHADVVADGRDWSAGV